MALFRSDALFLIAGPCQLEDDALNFRVAEHLARLAEQVPGGIVFKASFDKANRSNPGATRGPGLERGLAALARVKERSGLPVLTDVHLPEQCAPAAEVVDVLQIPAFLCRQTDLLEAAGATGKPVNVKKGQWMHPEGMRGAVEKVRRAAAERFAASGAARGAPPREHDAAASGGSRKRSNADRIDVMLVADDSARGAPPRDQHAPTARDSRNRSSAGDIEVAVTERGSFFGYGDLVVDMRSFVRMRAACDAPVIFDATHSVQQPGRGEGGASGGAREFIPPLALAACAAGADGLFMETHPDPSRAPSDGPNMIPLERLDDLVARCVDIWARSRR